MNPKDESRQELFATELRIVIPNKLESWQIDVAHNPAIHRDLWIQVSIWSFKPAVFWVLQCYLRSQTWGNLSKKTSSPSHRCGELEKKGMDGDWNRKFELHSRECVPRDAWNTRQTSQCERTKEFNCFFGELDEFIS